MVCKTIWPGSIPGADFYQYRDGKLTWLKRRTENPQELVRFQPRPFMCKARKELKDTVSTTLLGSLCKRSTAALEAAGAGALPAGPAYSLLAQMEAQIPLKDMVPGSNPGQAAYGWFV